MPLTPKKSKTNRILSLILIMVAFSAMLQGGVVMRNSSEHNMSDMESSCQKNTCSIPISDCSTHCLFSALSLNTVDAIPPTLLLFAVALAAALILSYSPELVSQRYFERFYYPSRRQILGVIKRE